MPEGFPKAVRHGLRETLREVGFTLRLLIVGIVGERIASVTNAVMILVGLVVVRIVRAVVRYICDTVDVCIWQFAC